MCRFDEAIAETKRAEELGPLSPYVLTRLGMVHWMAGRNQEAREKWKRVVELQSNFARAHASLGIISALESKFDEAVDEAEKAVKISDESSESSLHRSMLLPMTSNWPTLRAAREDPRFVNLLKESGLR